MIVMPEYATTVTVTRAADVGKQATGQSKGMTRKSAIVNQSPSLCSSIMTAKPHSSSDVHTHGPQDTIIYCLKGTGKIAFDNGKNVVEVKEGDFALIPQHCEHQEINDSEDEIVWVIVRSGSEPVVKNLGGWGGQETSS